MPHQLEGYIPDLLSEIEKVQEVADANIKFKMSPVEDGKYGSIGEDGKWDGMIRKLKDGVRKSLMRHDLLYMIQKIVGQKVPSCCTL